MDIDASAAQSADATRKDRKQLKRKGRGKGQGAADSTRPVALGRLEGLALSPYDRVLHTANVRAAESDEEREEARMFMSSMVSLYESDWLEWIQEKKTKAAVSPTLEACIDILELYKRACADYLSPRLHVDYATYAVSLFYKARGYAFPDVLQDEDISADTSKVDAVAEAVFTEEFVREELQTAVNQGIRWHLTSGQLAWKVLHDFELDHLRRYAPADGVNRMEAIYIQRLSEPHSDLSETHQLFSTFVSAYKADSYEASMVASQKIYNATRKLVDVREAKELELKKSSFSVRAYKNYIDWEEEVKHPNYALVSCLYERALNANPSDAELWQSYGALLLRGAQDKASSVPSKPKPEDVGRLCDRIVRSVPQSGGLAAACVRFLETLEDRERTSAFCQTQLTKITDTITFGQDVDGLVQLVTACADVVRHGLMDVQEQISDELVDVLMQGIAKVHELSNGTGDPLLRLERYLLRVYEKAGYEEHVETLFAYLYKHYPASSALVLLRVEHDLRHDHTEGVRKHYVAASKKRLDYPEYVYDSWLAFEHREGTLSTLQKALDTVKHEMTFVSARRLKEAQKAANKAALQSSTTVGEALDAPKNTSSVDAASEAVRNTLKRAASVEADEANDDQAPAIKRMKQESPPRADIEVKRDRENATVFVANLPRGIEEIAVKNLFRDCGNIREIKFKALQNEAVATIEFVSREAVPAALTKDKKRLAEHEIAVYPDWQSTLYVTNFPDTFDAGDLQALFESYGKIFETRWPSKRYKATRRFAYVQYVAPASAQAGLILHGTELTPGSGQRLYVKLSDPTRKQTRSDADANKRELYITGLPYFAKEGDLEKLCQAYGSLKGVRMGIDEDGRCKGYGFVEFEEEDAANAALALNNVEFKKRRLAVVIADSRLTNKKKQPESGLGRQRDIKSRSVIIHGLPDGVQEPLLQQHFEQYGAVETVDLLSAGEALITYQSAADTAKLLLLSEPTNFNGHALTITENKGADSRKNNMARKSEAAFLPRRGRGRGAKLGIGARRGDESKATVTSAVQGASGSDKAATDGLGDAGTKRNQADFKAMLMRET